MDDNMRDNEEHTFNAERAAGWLQRMPSASEEDKRQFLKWLRRSPENVGETLLATGTDVVLRQFFKEHPMEAGSFATASNVVGIDTRSSQPRMTTSPPRRWYWAGAGIAAVLALAAVIFLRDAGQYRTAAGEQRAIALEDGSTVLINTQSVVKVRFTRDARDITLERGQALFTVAKDASRPFRVHAGDTVVRAIGTKFDVRRQADRVHVAVVEGVVQVDAKRLTSGLAVDVHRGRISEPKPINLTEVSAWPQRRLVFSNSTLQGMAEEFSRYHQKPRIRIEGAGLQARQLSGVFDADSPEALLLYLSADPTLEFDRGEDEIVIRKRSRAAPAETASADSAR